MNELQQLIVNSLETESDEGFRTMEDIDSGADSKPVAPVKPSIPADTSVADRRRTEKTPQVTDYDVPEEDAPAKGSRKRVEPSDEFVRHEGVQESSDDSEFSIKPLVKAIYDRQGWEYSDEVIKRDDIDGLLDMVEDIVVANSVPRYASELTMNFDEFVKRGGDPRVFLDYISETPDPAKLPLQTEEQKLNAIRLYYRNNSNFSDAKIERNLEQIKARGLIDDELPEAVQFLRQEFDGRQRKLVEQAEYQRQQDQEQTRRYLESLYSYINQSEGFAGFEAKPNDKKGFWNYIAVRDSQGLTAYEKYIQNPETQIHLAYLAYMGVDKHKLEKNIKKDTFADVKKSLSKLNDSARKGSSYASSPGSKNFNIKDHLPRDN